MQSQGHKTQGAFWIQIGYSGFTCALILASETFLMARATDSTLSLTLLIVTQVALCFVLWIASRNGKLFGRISPIWICLLFLVGVFWTLGIPEISGQENSSVLVVLPAAILFGLGNSLNGYYFFDYCRLTPSSKFCPIAIGGAAIGALFNYFISYIMPAYASILCGIFVFGWYLFRREVSKITASRALLDFEFIDEKRSIKALYLSIITLSLSCGFIPTIIFTSDTLISENGNIYLFIVITLLVFVSLLIALKWKESISISTLIITTIVLAATGYLVLPLHSRVIDIIAAAIIFISLLISAQTIFYFYAQYLRDPKDSPNRFWSIQIIVLLTTSACTFVGITLAGSFENSIVMPLCLFSIWCLLLFLIMYHRIQVALPQVIYKDSQLSTNHNELEQRCDELAIQSGLTKRETEVLHLIADGWTISMIAHKLVVAPDTVRAHVKHIYTKTGTHSRSELLEHLGFIDEP